MKILSVLILLAIVFLVVKALNFVVFVSMDAVIKVVFILIAFYLLSRVGEWIVRKFK